MTASRFDGKVALITGAARGQGAAAVRAFVRDGGRVVISDVLEAEGRAVADSLDGHASFVAHDVTSAAQWAGAVEHAISSFGGVDVLVNNAGIHQLAPIDEEDEASFRRVLDVNLIGPFLGIQAVIPAMRDRGGGSIVNISSTGGLTGLPWHAAYGSSKWGLRGLTRTAAVELGPQCIRVNSVHPGAVDTPMLPPDRAGLGDARFASLPLGRVGQPADVAEVVCFLASDAAAYVTGGEFAVDGGATAGPGGTTPRPGGGQ